MSRFFRILHLIDSLAIGGAERMLVEIANATVSDGHRAGVCITRTETTLCSGLCSEIPVFVLGRTSRFDLKGFQKIRGVIEEFKPDVLHVHGRSTMGLIAFMRAIGVVKIPVLFHDHFGSIETDMAVPKWFRFFGRFFVDQYVGVAPKLGKWARVAGLPGSSISVIGNALAIGILEQGPALDRQSLGLGPGLCVGLVVGGIREQKGIHYLIEACSEIDLDGPWRILIAGAASDPVYEEECRQMVNRLGLRNRVVFLGVRRDIPALIRAVDFAVIPSISESGPLVLIEFLAAGLPFVATRVGEISKKTESAGIGSFVDPGAPGCLAEEIRSVILLPAVARKALGKEGIKYAEEIFAIKKVMPRWYEVYRKVVGK